MMHENRSLVHQSKDKYIYCQAQPSCSFTGTELALFSALSRQALKVLSSLISVLTSKAKLLVSLVGPKRFASREAQNAPKTMTLYTHKI